MMKGAIARQREHVRQRTEPAGVRQRFAESRQRLLIPFGERERVAGVVEERGPVGRLRQQLRRSVKRAQRQARDRLGRLVRVHGRDRQHAEHARRNVGLFLGQPAKTGDPLGGIICGLRVELGRAEVRAASLAPRKAYPQQEPSPLRARVPAKMGSGRRQGVTSPTSL